MSDNKSSEIRVRNLTYLEIINKYLPEKYAKKLSNPDYLRKIADSLDWKPNQSVSYYDRNAVEEIALKLHRKDPTMKAPQIYDDSEMQAVIGENPMFERNTIIRWIQRIIKIKKERGWDKSP